MSHFLTSYLGGKHQPHHSKKSCSTSPHPGTTQQVVARQSNMEPGTPPMELQAGHPASILPWLGSTRLCAEGVGRVIFWKNR
jgi:hypothetical protein